MRREKEREDQREMDSVSGDERNRVGTADESKLIYFSTRSSVFILKMRLPAIHFFFQGHFESHPP